MQVVTFDRVQQKVVLLKQLLKILRNGDEYARDRHGVAKATLIRQHKYGHLDEVAAQAKLDKWIYLQKLDRIHRLQITIYDQPSDTVNSNGQPQSNYTLDQVRQMILYCFGVNTKDVNFFNISNLQVAERVCVYLLEDARQTQRFEMELESQFDHVLDYAPQEHWLFNLLRIKVSNRQNNILSEFNGEKEVECSRTSLLLSFEQMIHNQYPIPMLMNDHYECTNVGYAPVSDDSPIFAIDCEMCLTHARRHQLARISIVDEDLNVLLDCYVRPEEPVLDYLTCYSGVTKQHLDEATMTIQDVQLFIQHNLPADCILVGHSLNSDLHAMRICHPYVIDTSVIYNMSSHRDIKPSLKALSKFYLSTQIQQGTNGHCSIEDAQSTMSLVQLKLRKGLMFGDLCLANDQRMQRPDKAFISMSEHLEEQLGPEVKVYFDHPDAHSLQRFVSVHSKYSSRLNSMISASFACRRTVCIVVSNQRAYINVNS